MMPLPLLPRWIPSNNINMLEIEIVRIEDAPHLQEYFNERPDQEYFDERPDQEYCDERPENSVDINTGDIFRNEEEVVRTLQEFCKNTLSPMIKLSRKAPSVKDG